MQRFKIIEGDPYLEPFEQVIINRYNNIVNTEKTLCGNGTLSDFANGHQYYGLHTTPDGKQRVLREWAPNAREVYIIGEFSQWKPLTEYSFTPIGQGNWEINLPVELLPHESIYKLFIIWEGGCGERLPAWSRRVVQNVELRIFNAQVWAPPTNYEWQHPRPSKPKFPLIYEAHVGMSAMEGKVASFSDFTKYVIPHIASSGYNTIQLMAIQEHPYYGSFGYHVSNFFAVSSRFGTPEELKALIDTAHSFGLYVIMDIVHSHAVKNEIEGLGRFDGTLYQYFHDGSRGNHQAWDSRCFNYNKHEVLHFLLSNCKFWLDEYHFDGFRFDGVTSMLYHDHGLGSDFMSYNQYYNLNQDEDALCYLGLANKLIHSINPGALTIAEEMSGMPGVASPFEEGGTGFDYRLAMGTPDFWVKQLKEVKDEFRHVGDIFYNLSNKRADEKIISYAESHDQALVGDQTIIFRLMGANMYTDMHKGHNNIFVDRGMALHKMIRLITLSCAGNGYLNFMGNEFGHPEWIDFPREGNNWSYHYARRQWNLLLDENLRYKQLYDFDKSMISLVNAHHFEISSPKAVVQNIDDQVLVYERDNLFFVFNFSPFNSYTGYGFQVPKGEYEIILNTDNALYGGHHRINENLTYNTLPFKEMNMLSVYLPTLTALVFRKI